MFELSHFEEQVSRRKRESQGIKGEVRSPARRYYT